MHFEGYKLRAIAKALEIDKKQVSYAIHKFKEYDPVEINLRKQNKCSSTKFDEEEKKQMIERIEYNNLLSLKEIHNAIQTEIEIECGQYTLYKYITEFVKFIVPSYKPMLNHAYKKVPLLLISSQNKFQFQKCHFHR
ncbi:hypothetical protein ABPG72_006585 [Tetrahymena utriculariae]